MTVIGSIVIICILMISISFILSVDKMKPHDWFAVKVLSVVVGTVIGIVMTIIPMMGESERDANMQKVGYDKGVKQRFKQEIRIDTIYVPIESAITR